MNPPSELGPQPRRPAHNQSGPRVELAALIGVSLSELVPVPRTPAKKTRLNSGQEPGNTPHEPALGTRPKHAAQPLTTSAFAGKADRYAV